MRTILLAILVSLVSAAGAAGDPPDLRALVGPDEFATMGLDKLSAQQQQRLATWILRARDGRAVPYAVPSVGFAMDGVEVRSEPMPPAMAAAPSKDALPPPVAPAAPAPMVASMPPAPAAPMSAPATTMSPALGAAAFGSEQVIDDGGMRELHAHIAGAFTGWDGKTRFTLDNGQVWRQSTPGEYRFKATDPEIVIERTAFGYKLRLMETKRSINVRRVK